jgi:hypothetical protein
MTQSQLAAFEARQRRPADRGEGIVNESRLHTQILGECRHRGWIALHGAMSERTGRTLGEWDFTIIADGRVFLIECKSRDGKLRPEQRALIAWAAKLGHTVHVVRSFEQFLEVVK